MRAYVSKLLITLLLMSLTQGALANGRTAPEWDISEWINGDGTTLASLKGKVVVIDFFQLWCPGCNSFSVPLMAKWEQQFADEIAAGNLVMLSIHTVFEGHDYQNPKKLRAYLKQKNIQHLVGIDRHIDGDEIPETMKRYRTRGTPEMAIIDKDGHIRFQRFGSFDPASGAQLINKLLAGDPG
ncbi:MAG: alkyl hydroperoxide reductase [endosymbiont of Escarpia spicata]|uniref:Alkyl hydroperoxide reductase n=1 Tax=endosymbiont of Escarpia spicata TaxID=2200908 RepID=A0A370DBG1_9GAMM|nr:MAG: alkyl hydroperoxide reductase [endosymbiont of Escarpia spicata]